MAGALPGVQLQFTPPWSLRTLACRESVPRTFKEAGVGVGTVPIETEGPLLPELELLLHATKAAIKLTPMRRVAMGREIDFWNVTVRNIIGRLR